jgi:glutathione S-transferase
MRRLTHILMSPACRATRIILGEKHLAFSSELAIEGTAHLPVLSEEDGTKIVGMWAIIDHVEGLQPDPPLIPEDAGARAEALRLFDWVMTKFNDEVTKRIVFEKASRAQTGSLENRPPNMETVRMGRATLAKALPEIATLAERRGYLAGRDITLADIAVAAHVSALDYFGEIPWADNKDAAEWYTRIKSRPSFRPLLSDRIPGQPPAMHYAELDF